MKRYVVLLLLLIAATVRGQAANASPFGIVEGFWFPQTTCDLGVGWERIIFDWSQHQPAKSDDWNTLNVDDRWLKEAALCGREVVGLLKNTPQWATDGSAGVGVPKNLGLPIDDPANYWANFVRKTVDYYASRGVTRFIIWNEPDITADTYGHEFAGDLEDYFQLLKVAYLAAKSVNPATQIHLSGTTWWHDINEGRQPYFERLMTRIQQDPDAAANGDYFDVVSLHIYFRVDTITKIVGEVRAMLASHGMRKDIWINETNAAPTDDPAWQVVRPQYPLDLTQQASFLVQASALALAADVERIAAYKLYDQQLSPGAESFGILSPDDGSPRPAYYAWQFVAQRFTAITQAALAQTPTLAAVRLSHADGRESMVLWARTDQPATVTIKATESKAALFDALGGVRYLTPVDDQYTVVLPPAQCNANDGCFIGGMPFTLVQMGGEVGVTEQTQPPVPLVFPNE